jgi:hypothetical protein
MRDVDGEHLSNSKTKGMNIWPRLFKFMCRIDHYGKCLTD